LENASGHISLQEAAKLYFLCLSTDLYGIEYLFFHCLLFAADQEKAIVFITVVQEVIATPGNLFRREFRIQRIRYAGGNALPIDRDDTTILL
jgi:hypothetical protein